MYHSFHKNIKKKTDLKTRLISESISNEEKVLTYKWMHIKVVLAISKGQ